MYFRVVSGVDGTVLGEYPDPAQAGDAALREMVESRSDEPVVIVPTLSTDDELVEAA